MLAAIALQRLGGAWGDAEGLQAVCGVRVECPGELAGNSAFATALAVALLRKRFADRRSKWTMIKRKALRWLAQQVADNVVARLVDLL
jgi:hypothetical protein